MSGRWQHAPITTDAPVALRVPVSVEIAGVTSATGPTGRSGVFHAPPPGGSVLPVSVEIAGVTSATGPTRRSGVFHAPPPGGSVLPVSVEIAGVTSATGPTRRSGVFHAPRTSGAGAGDVTTVAWTSRTGPTGRCGVFHAPRRGGGLSAARSQSMRWGPLSRPGGRGPHPGLESSHRPAARAFDYVSAAAYHLHYQPATQHLDSASTGAVQPMTLATGIDKDGLLGVAEVSRLVNLEPDVLTALVLQKSVRGGHVDGQTRIDLGSVVELTGKVPEGFVPVPSAAEMTGLRVRSLYRLIARGRVTGLSFYSQVHINLEELLEYTGPDVPKGYVWLLEAAERAGCPPDRLYALARRKSHTQHQAWGACIRQL